MTSATDDWCGVLFQPSLADDVRATAYKIPTDEPEADGTYSWNETTIVIADVAAFYFHVETAHGILRSKRLKIGNANYLGKPAYL